MVESLSTVCLYFFASVFKMNMLDLANLLDNDGNMQNEMMVMAFAATLLSTIPVLLGNEFDVNVGKAINLNHYFHLHVCPSIHSAAFVRHSSHFSVSSH